MWFLSKMWADTIEMLITENNYSHYYFSTTHSTPRFSVSFCHQALPRACGWGKGAELNSCFHPLNFVVVFWFWWGFVWNNFLLGGNLISEVWGSLLTSCETRRKSFNAPVLRVPSVAKAGQRDHAGKEEVRAAKGLENRRCFLLWLSSPILIILFVNRGLSERLPLCGFPQGPWREVVCYFVNRVWVSSL